MLIRGTTIEDWKRNLAFQAAGKLVHEGEVGKILTTNQQAPIFEVTRSPLGLLPTCTSHGPTRLDLSHPAIYIDFHAGDVRGVL